MKTPNKPKLRNVCLISRVVVVTARPISLHRGPTAVPRTDLELSKTVAGDGSIGGH